MTPPIAVFGHRGWPLRFPDNTLPGFLAAATVCDGVEADVRRSADGKLVLAHDVEIGGLEVAASPWSVLSDIDLGGGAKPCLLDEILSALPDRRVLMEIKNGPGEPGFEPDNRVALEAASRARDLDVVMSFNWATADAVRSSFPDVQTGLIAGVLGDVGEAVRHAIRLGHRNVILDVDLLAASEAPIPSDVSVHVWSTRSGQVWSGMIDQLASRGVSGIITDDPAAVTQLLGSFDDDPR